MFWRYTLRLKDIVNESNPPAESSNEFDKFNLPAAKSP